MSMNATHKQTTALSTLLVRTGKLVIVVNAMQGLQEMVSLAAGRFPVSCYHPVLVSLL